MLLLLVIIVMVPGILLSLLGGSIIPVWIAVLSVSLILLVWTVVNIGTQILQRQVISLQYVAVGVSGSLVLELIVSSYFLLESGLGHSVRAKALFPYKCLISFLVVVVIPSLVVLVYRAFQTARPDTYSRPGPVVICRRMSTITLLTVLGLSCLIFFVVLLPLYGGWPPLMLAARIGSPWLVSLCLGLNADLNADQHGVTPLDVAIENGHIPVVSLLLKKGAQVQPVSGRCCPLYDAVGRGNIEIVRLLLDFGAEVNARADDFGRSAMIKAAMHGYHEIAVLLLARGADINARDLAGCTPLIYALPYPQLMKVLLEHGADMNAQCFDNNIYLPGDTPTALMIACFNGYTPAIMVLLENGADPHIRSRQGNTALSLSSSSFCHDVVR